MAELSVSAPEADARMSDAEDVSPGAVPVSGRGAHASSPYVLDEIQSATFCRKSGRRDRRTLDPPPVLSLQPRSPERDASGSPPEGRAQEQRYAVALTMALSDARAHAHAIS
jgi:hypothetical protein